MHHPIAPSLTEVWIDLVEDIMEKGREVSPRGMKTKELPQHTIIVDTRLPVLTIPERKLNYKFMAAESYWILAGDNRVATIAPYNSNIAQFSDDGETFSGAYGPKIVEQLPYVVGKLREDPDTRQAVMTIWRPSPGPSKDIPCTVAIAFNIRKNQLNAHVFMRSSDAYLGIPYDVFNFSMLTHLVCCYLNAEQPQLITPGLLYLTAASSHLYERNWHDAVKVSQAPTLEQHATPKELFTDEDRLMLQLSELRLAGPGAGIRWWEV